MPRIQNGMCIVLHGVFKLIKNLKQRYNVKRLTQYLTLFLLGLILKTFNKSQKLLDKIIYHE